MNNIHRVKGRILSVEHLAINIANNYDGYDITNLPNGSIVTAVDGTVLANYVVSDKGGLCRKLLFANKLQDLVVMPEVVTNNDDLLSEDEKIKQIILKLNDKINSPIENFEDIYDIKATVIELINFRENMNEPNYYGGIFINNALNNTKKYCSEFISVLEPELSKTPTMDGFEYWNCVYEIVKSIHAFQNK